MTPYQQLNAAYLAMIAHCPNACVELGLDEQLNRLPSPAPTDREQLLAKADAVLAAAEQCVDLDFDQQQDVTLMRLSAERVHFMHKLEREGRRRDHALPRAGEQISGGIFLLMSRDPRQAEQRLDNIRQRLAAVPALLEGTLAQLDRPIARWVQIEHDTLEELPSLFQSIQQWAEQVTYSDQPALQHNITSALDAIAAYRQGLDALPTATDFTLGEENARTLVALNGIELSLEQIHQHTRDFVADTLANLEQLRQTLVARYQLPEDTDADGVHQFLNQRFAVAVPDGRLQAVIERYQAEAERIGEFIQARQLFDEPDDHAMTIMRTPEFMAPMIPAGAMMQPAALADGTKTSQIYLTLSEALLDEHTELGIPVMMIHEGIPGHHLQLATASGNDSLVRRVFPAMELAEGWTTMLEDYMLDIGYMGELTDEARFIAKRDISRLSARVAIDLYFMTGQRHYLDIGYPVDTSSDDPFVNAGRLLKVVTGFTDGRVQGELNWYSQEPGYPMSYLVGNVLMWQLKRDFVHDGNALARDRAFHREVLACGNLPMAMVRARLAQRGRLRAAN
ncbi:protein of unknown function DUF885 [Ferrimonas balearica DSM 9799]|uniref:DUF885 domain-containing protein n=1 Tax=Ferrimonas balearica (strain DSM 9799 / CCM 4581 / KCTC 23876 / PAT) TaxID=550540 RepID=E1SNJ5_FERBD|nr:DUF885 domain-containing protein [Ferrimonas balearica]ADN76668.1 protein of unknown function DUF885 [Ferrimonas balearica DSM 9799]